MSGVKSRLDAIVEGGWVIQMDGDVPSYFAPELGVKMGNITGGWGEKKEAMRFLRERDARVFIYAFLPHLKGVCQAVHHG